MPYSVVTKDGIQIDNIPDSILRDSEELRKRVETARVQYNSQATQETEPDANVGDFFESLVGGTKNIISDARTALEAPFVSAEEAALRGIKRRNYWCSRRSIISNTHCYC